MAKQPKIDFSDLTDEDVIGLVLNTAVVANQTHPHIVRIVHDVECTYIIVAKLDSGKGGE